MSILPKIAPEVLEHLREPIDFAALERDAREFAESAAVADISSLRPHSLSKVDPSKDFPARRWGVAWTPRDYFGCVQFVTVLGRLREPADSDALRLLNSGGWALKTLELFWCQTVQVDDPDHELEQPNEFIVGVFVFDQLQLFITQYVELFVFAEYPPFNALYAAAMLLDCAATEFQSLCRGAIRLNSRGEIALGLHHTSFAKAFHFLCGTSDIYEGSSLEATFARRIGQEMHAVVQEVYEGTGSDAVVYSFYSLEECIRTNPAVHIRKEGLHVSERSERAWRVLWLTALREIARDPQFTLHPAFHYEKLVVMPQHRALEDARQEAIAVRRQFRNFLRVRALHPAFRLAADDLCAHVLQFLA